MTDNSNSTGSSGSSTNSWTILSPEEATVENIGPVDDGTESLGDVPSLSEEVAGATVESKPSEIQVETILSEEGHQVCQETSPETSVPPSPSRSSPLHAGPLDSDPETQAPVIHDIVTSSPGDHEHLGAMPFVTNLDLGAPLDIPDAELFPAEMEPEPPPPESEVPVPAEPCLDTPADIGPITEPFYPVVERPVPSAEPEVSVPVESLTAIETFSEFDAGVSPSLESPEAVSQIPESLAAESPIPVSFTDSLPETIASAETTDETEEKEETEKEEAEAELPEKVTHVEREEAPVKSGFDFPRVDTSSDDDGLRRRKVPSFEAPRRTSDEEDEESELEFRLAERKEEETRGFSMNRCIVAALVLLCLGSLFLSDDIDSSEQSDEELNQDWIDGNPQDMKELLDKLAQENQQISQLEVQLRSQKDELDSAIKAAVTTGDHEKGGNGEKENAERKDELSSLPGLKEELDTLRARVTELTQLTAPQTRPTPTPQSAPHPAGQPGEHNQTAAGPEWRRDPREPGKLKEELQRQKVLLEGSRTRLDGMKRGGDSRKGVRDGLEEIQRRLSAQVEQLGMRKPWETNKGGNRGKESGREHWKKEEKKKEWRSEKDWKSHGKEGGREDKDERREKDWKSHGKHNSHKEKYQDEWERKKDERRMDRETRRKEKPWHHSHSHQHHHHQPHQPNQHHHQPHQPNQHHHQPQQPIQHRHQPHQYNHDNFWRQQAEKLQRNVRPQVGCRGVEDCATKEGLYPVELSEFEELLEGYLSKLEGSSTESKDQVRRLTAGFFEDGAFVHNKVLFSAFAEDVADILEDMADVLEDEGREDNDALEQEMEEFEREALWKFAATT